jgi:hypothetical protein
MRRDGGILLDAHVMTLSGVRSKIRSQMASRGCFYIKALKDGVIIHDSTGCMRLLQAEATAIFFARPAFSNWMSIRLNLSSRLRDMDHSWTFVERTLIGAEMVKSVMCIWALRHRGWAARMDVMRKWAVEDCPDRIFALDEAFTRMISGQSEAFKSIVIEALDDIGGVIAADERIRKRI